MYNRTSAGAPGIQPRIPHTTWSRTIAVSLGAAATVALILMAFIWPTMTSSVKDIPLAVVGTSQSVASVTRTLDDKAPGVFDVTTVANRADAVKLIRTRDAYGAIVVGTHPQVLTASANGVAVSQILDQLAGELQTQANAAAQAGVAQAIATGKAPAGTVAPSIQVKVTDIVPLASTDSRGLGLTAASFPLVLGGIIGGVLISLLVAGAWRRLTAVAVYSMVSGLAVAGILQGWFGVLQGGYLLNTSAVALAMAATASFIVGVNALIGTPGIAVGSVITMLVGNPLSAAAQPLQFMVGPWGAVGQWFVPGASSTLIRDLSYFPDANRTFAWLVLAGWTALGVIATLLGHFRNQEVVHTHDALEPKGEHVAEPVHGRHADEDLTPALR